MLWRCRSFSHFLPKKGLGGVGIILIFEVFLAQVFTLMAKKSCPCPSFWKWFDSIRYIWKSSTAFVFTTEKKVLLVGRVGNNLVIKVFFRTFPAVFTFTTDQKKSFSCRSCWKLFGVVAAASRSHRWCSPDNQQRRMAQYLYLYFELYLFSLGFVFVFSCVCNCLLWSSVHRWYSPDNQQKRMVQYLYFYFVSYLS